MSPPKRFSVAEYERLTAAGILTGDDQVELLAGYIVKKPRPTTPPHDGCLMRLWKALRGRVSDGWLIRIRSGLVLTESVPEPDLVVARASADSYATAHPRAADTSFVAELADPAHAADRVARLPIYAEAGIPFYWIVNLVDRQVEVYANPVGNAYTLRTDYPETASVPFLLDGVLIADIAVGPLLP